MSTTIGRMEQLGLLADAAPVADEWSVRTSRRARRLAVRILPGGQVEIVVPPGTRPRAVQQFVSRHRRWIDHKLSQYRPVDATPPGALPRFIEFTAAAESWPVDYVEGAGAPRAVAAGLRVRVSGALARHASVRHALQRFVMRRARDILLPWLDAVSAETGLAHAGATIRRQRTRWGSCSRHARLSLNACLLFQPPDVVRYLLVHELAHTRHLDHSRRFWNLVARLEPRWRELDAALTCGWRLVPAWAIAPVRP